MYRYIYVYVYVYIIIYILVNKQNLYTQHMAISTMVNAKPLFAVRKTEGSQGDGESHLT